VLFNKQADGTFSHSFPKLSMIIMFSCNYHTSILLWRVHMRSWIQ